MKFFHQIERVKREGRIFEGPQAIKEEANKYFSLLYKKENLLRPKLEGVNFPFLSSECLRNLENYFEEDEIVRALKDRDGDKAPAQTVLISPSLMLGGTVLERIF